MVAAVCQNCIVHHVLFSFENFFIIWHPKMNRKSMNIQYYVIHYILYFKMSKLKTEAPPGSLQRVSVFLNLNSMDCCQKLNDYFASIIKLMPTDIHPQEITSTCIQDYDYIQRQLKFSNINLKEDYKRNIYPKFGKN